jgi:predicted glycosyltransferase
MSDRARLSASIYPTNQKLVGESAIVLAAGGGNDGYLTVDEILDLKLNIATTPQTINRPHRRFIT